MVRAAGGHTLADSHRQEPGLKVKIVQAEFTELADADSRLNEEGQDAEVAGMSAGRAVMVDVAFLQRRQGTPPESLAILSSSSVGTGATAHAMRVRIEPD